jgi:hypothetical protein
MNPKYINIAENTKCLRCSGSLEEGFIRDAVPLGSVPSAWYRGPLQRSRWMGVQTLGKAHYQVRTYRCKQCGLLESYAFDSDLGQP